MYKYEAKEVTNKNVWEGFVLKQQPQTFLQSWNWGEINKSSGDKIIRLGFYKDKKLVGICLFIKQTAKRGPHLLVPAGPLIDWGNKKLVKFVFDSIKTIALKENVWFVRIRPEILSNSENKKLFKDFGLISSPMHLHAENTWVLDITQDEEKLMAQMRKTTRYLVRKSINEDLQIEISSDSKFAKDLYALQRQTAKRHGFVGFPQKLFEDEIEILSNDKQAKVFVIKKQKEILAVAIIVFYADSAYYHFSASTSDFSKIPFSYRLQWEVIKYAKEKGVKKYNFWGIAPDDNPKHRFAGVTLFKTGFGGVRIDWLHAHDMVISSKYYLTYIFETLRKNFRRL